MSRILHNTLKSDLRLILPRTIKTSHIDEAVASGLGYASYAAMPKSSDGVCPLDFGWKASARLHALSSSSQCWVTSEQMLEACCEVALHRREGMKTRVFPQLGALSFTIPVVSAVLLEALELADFQDFRSNVTAASVTAASGWCWNIYDLDRWPAIHAMTRYLKPGGLIMRPSDHSNHHGQLVLPLGDRLEVMLSSHGCKITWHSPKLPLSLKLLPSMSNMDEASYACIAHAVANRRRILITGATGSGKTSLADMLLACIPWRQLVCVISDPMEFKVPSARPGLLWGGDTSGYMGRLPNLPLTSSIPPDSWLVMSEINEACGPWAMRQAAVSNGTLLAMYPVGHRSRESGTLSEQALRRIREWHMPDDGGRYSPAVDFIISIDRRSKVHGMSISCWNVGSDWSMSRAC